MKKLIAGAAAALAVAACAFEDPIPSETPSDAAVSVTLRGMAIASTSCAPCHGAALLGDTVSSIPAPSLQVVQQYTWAQFDSLLGSGRTLSGLQVDGAMPLPSSPVQSLSDSQRRVLYEYLAYYWRP